MTKKVAIVDDSKELRSLIKLLIEDRLGVACLEYGSLAEVEAQADNVLLSHMIVVDINLGTGRPDGVDVYRWLRGKNFGGKIFFLTGHAKQSPYVREAAETGVPILEKPMTPDDLVLVLKDAMDGACRQPL